MSNLSFISKLVERVVCVQLVEHLKTNNLYEIFQSAYRQLHSTETALLRVQNDLLQAVDNEGGAILVLLDLSAAFDTIDHQKLLNLLNQSFGIRGVALKWFESYLKDRTQTVQIGSCTSTPVTLKYGVPQGSVLGPILFTMYTTPLGNIIRKHGLTFHLYADDTQLYISFQPGVSVSKETAISCLEACIKDIKIWMTNNLLKLNDDKTELIVITTHSNTSQNQNIGINIGDSLITPSSEPPRNLGVLFDSTCSLNDHVSKICKSINYNLYSIGKIRKYLDTPTAEKMINCSTASRLDYCNSLLYGAKGYNKSQLQLCQNNAARMLSLRRKFDHITPVLKDLHWLPVEQRIEYKVLLLTYKALHGKAPAYISQLLSLYTPTRPLRSENKNLLRVPRCRLEGFGRRCFAYAAPSLWNPLPTPVKRASSIDTFKSSLKSYLFNVAYPRSTESYIVWVYYLWLIFSVFYLQALLSTVTSYHFFYYYSVWRGLNMFAYVQLVNWLKSDGIDTAHNDGKTNTKLGRIHAYLQYRAWQLSLTVGTRFVGVCRTPLSMLSASATQLIKSKGRHLTSIHVGFEIIVLICYPTHELRMVPTQIDIMSKLWRYYTHIAWL